MGGSRDHALVRVCGHWLLAIIPTRWESTITGWRVHCFGYTNANQSTHGHGCAGGATGEFTDTHLNASPNRFTIGDGFANAYGNRDSNTATTDFHTHGAANLYRNTRTANAHADGATDFHTNGAANLYADRFTDRYAHAAAGATTNPAPRLCRCPCG